jgi:hypothetical protein
VQYLWIQEVAKRKDIRIKKVSGTENVADILTKAKGYQEYVRLLRKVSIHPKKPHESMGE